MHEIVPSSGTSCYVQPISSIAENISLIFEGRSGALYLGSWAASVDNELLANNHIRAIVEVLDAPWGSTPLPTPAPLGRTQSGYGFEQARTDGRSVSTPGQMGRYKVAIADSSAVDILKPHLDGAVRFIKDRLAVGDNVLVHCQQVRRVFIFFLPFHPSLYYLPNPSIITPSILLLFPNVDRCLHYALTSLVFCFCMRILD